MKKPLALVIEDDNDIAEMFASVLHEADFATEIILTGDVALKRLAAVVPDVVLLDLRLPYVPGLDIFTQISKDKRLARTRVIVVTANPDMARSLPANAPFVLYKPVDLKQLRALIKRLDPRS
jgi:DNA-binding response OmpR family regulator